jgi:hypothetical protein
MRRIELIRTSFHRRAAEIAEPTQRVGSLCAPSVFSAPLRFAVSRLRTCCGIRQHIYESEY